MSGELNSVVRALTGPRCLRSALRQKTVAINRLLDGLSGPTELCVRIPASVFGGDIFGVMSSQLREALILPPQSQVSPATAERKGLNASTAIHTAKNSKNPFPLALDRSTRSTQSASFASEHTSRSSLAQSETPLEQHSVNQFSPLETGISRKGIEPRLFDETSLTSVMSSVNPIAPTRKKQLATTTAFTRTLDRYWQTVRASRDTAHSLPHTLTESRPDPVSRTDIARRPVTDSEQQTASRTWPNLVGRDVSDKLRSFTNPANPFQKSTHLNSQPDRQIQNVFNIEVNHANQLASNYGDLGERIAEILHEQALQHGIDIT